MSLATSKSNIKAIFLIISMLFMAILATTAQAATSTAILSYESSKSGPNIPVHDGGVSFSSFNESRSVDRLEASIRKSLAVLPDPYAYFRIDPPGTGVFTWVSLEPSSYYAYAYSPSKIYARVSISN